MKSIKVMVKVINFRQETVKNNFHRKNFYYCYSRNIKGKMQLQQYLSKIKMINRHYSIVYDTA